MATVQIGLIGMGTVGQAVVELNRPWAGLDFHFVKACVRRADRPRPLPIPLTQDPMEIIDDPALDIIVEVAGGREEPLAWIGRALANGKAVVTANKEVIAYHGAELIQKSQEWDTFFGFEASVAGGIPVVDTLVTHMSAAPLSDIGGVLNGTSSYVLTAMENGMALSEAISQAQLRGYAEANPENDLKGHDAVRKLVILVWLAWGVWLSPDQILREGLQDYPVDLLHRLARKGLHVRPWAWAHRDAEGTIKAAVGPAVVSKGHPAFSLKGAQNGVEIRGQAGTFWLQGPGAGGVATATSVWADIHRSQRLKSPLLALAPGSRAFVTGSPHERYVVAAHDPDRDLSGTLLGPGMAVQDEPPAGAEGLSVFPLINGSADG